MKIWKKVHRLAMRFKNHKNRQSYISIRPQPWMSLHRIWCYYIDGAMREVFFYRMLAREQGLHYGWTDRDIQHGEMELFRINEAQDFLRGLLPPSE